MVFIFAAEKSLTALHVHVMYVDNVNNYRQMYEE